MNPLAIRLLLLVEYGIFILGHHFLLTGHFVVPPFDGLGVLSVALQSRADGVDDPVNRA